MKSVSFILTACTVLLFLSACGQKGPLYLPQPDKANTNQSSK
ncbi:MAG: lipoprotein [Legionella sp.]|nr:lipoprotein [Legionella sp.]